MMNTGLRVLSLSLLIGLGPAIPSHAADESLWNDYLDLAYVYSSADRETLEARLDEYGKEAGISLDDFILQSYEVSNSDPPNRVEVRREAIAYLLRYLASRDLGALERSVEAIETFAGRQGRNENRYWYRYIMAHRALEAGDSDNFVRHILDLWLEVVSPLESPYEILSALSLSQSPNSGFVSALPYVYENIARLIMIRSQERGLSRDLDPLAVIVRLLRDDRVGAHPDVIPFEASSKPYLDRVVDRLDGPESDGGSLTFTLALFEASRHHETARSMLASEGLSNETIKYMAIASGAYEIALNRAETPQGDAAVYNRVLRQIGEIYAAKQRLKVDPHVENPFTIGAAMEVYRNLFGARNNEDWAELGFRRTDHKAYVETLHRLWQEIQETSLNAADYYLARSQSEAGQRDEHVRSAARIYASYLSFFDEFATQEGITLVPDSAYFAAYEAAKGYGDAFLSFSTGDITPAEIEMVSARYAMALKSYPFDRRVWGSLAAALERQGRSSEFLIAARPVVDTVTRSRHVTSWIEHNQPGAPQIEALRRAMMNDLVIMYLGFADASNLDELTTGLRELEDKRQDLAQTIEKLAARRDLLARMLDSASDSASSAQAKLAPGTDDRRDSQMERSTMTNQIAELQRLTAKLDQQIAGRKTAIPLYSATFASDELIPALRGQRQHPVHTLLRHMYHGQED